MATENNSAKFVGDNKYNEYGHTRLYDAVFNGTVANVRFCLSNGDDPNELNEDGRTIMDGMSSMSFTGRDGWEEKLQLLIEQEWLFDEASLRNGRTLLIELCHNATHHSPDRAEAALMLIRAGADVHKQGNSGETALSCIAGHLCADIWDGERSTTVYKLFEKGFELAQELIRRGAIVDSNGSELASVCRKGAVPQAVKLFLDAGSNPMGTNLGMPAVCLAEGRSQESEELIEAEIEIWLRRHPFKYGWQWFVWPGLKYIWHMLTYPCRKIKGYASFACLAWKQIIWPHFRESLFKRKST